MRLERKTINHYVGFAAILVFAATLPWGHKPFSVANNVSLMLLIANWLVSGGWRNKWELLKSDGVFQCLAAYYLVYVVSMLYTENTGAGAFVLEKKTGILVLPLCLATSPRFSAPQLRAIFRAFVFSCLIATLFCVAWAVKLNYDEDQTFSYLYNAIVHQTHLPGKYDYFNYWYFTYKLFAAPIQMHPIYLAMYVLFASCLAVNLWWFSASRWKWFALLLLLCFNFIVVVLLGSRTQLFCAVLLGTAFVLYRSWKTSRMLQGSLAIVMIIAVSLAVVLLNPVIRERVFVSGLPGTHFTENRYGEGGLSLRMYKWKYALEAISANPMLGAGAGDGQEVLMDVYARNDFQIGLERNFNPHNQFLQSALDTGVAGLAVLLLCFFVPARRAWRERSTLYAIFILLFFVSCITESMLEVNKGIAFFAFCHGLIGCNLLQGPAVNSEA